MTWTRRRFLTASAALPLASLAADAVGRTQLGVVQYSYAIRLAAERTAGVTGLADPLAFVEHCHRLGAGGVQVGIGARDGDYLARLRKKVEESGLYLEGTIRLPKDHGDLERFTAEVKAARDAGAKVLRTVLLGGRRYEQFTDMKEFRDAAHRAEASVKLAEPIAARHDMLLAIENHKDYRTGELLDLLRRLDSRHVGACVDTGNSIALLEDPMKVVEELAPWAFTVHLKDMAVDEYGEGFLLAEVPLGQGFLDLPKMIALLRKARPSIRFNLEMITRNPLRVPCLTDKYWATSPEVSARDLARTLALVRRHMPEWPLRRVGALTAKQQLALEDDNVRKSLAYSREHLGL